MVAFEDETWTELLPKVWKCWYLRGEQLEIPTPGRNKRINIFITLNFPTGKIFYSTHRRRRSREFKYHLGKLMRQARRRRLKRVVLIIDNSPIHKSAESRKFLKKYSDFLKVFRLPKYSPNLNEVEKVNRQLQRDVCANLFHGNPKNLTKTVRNYLRNLEIKDGKIYVR